MSEKNANEESPVEEGRKFANFILKALLAILVQDEEKRLPADVCEELIFQQGPIASELHREGGYAQQYSPVKDRNAYLPIYGKLLPTYDE